MAEVTEEAPKKKGGGNKIMIKAVPLSDRSYIHGDAELMGYTGEQTWDSLKKNYLDLGLRPRIRGRKKLYLRREVDQFIEEHDEWQEVHVGHGRRKKAEA